MTKNKIWKLVLSIVLAVALWSYVVSTVSPGSSKTFYNVKVDAQNLTGLSEKFIITDFSADVDVHLEGNRIDLSALDKSSIVVEADLSGIQKADTHSIDYTIRFTGNYAGNAFVVKNSSPERLTVKVENKISKPLDVKVVTTGTLKDYEYDENEIVANPKQITITGPESMLQDMEFAVVTVDLDQVTDSVDQEFDYVLCDKDLKRVETNEDLVHPETDERVRVIMPVYGQGEIPLGVNLIPGGGLQEENCKVTISPIDTLNIYGTPAALKTYKELILGDIDLSKIDFDDRSVEHTFTLDMTKFEGIHLYEGQVLPDKFTVKVELVNVATKELQIPAANIKSTGNPELDFMVQKDYITVKFRGDAEQIKKLTAADVVLMLDLTDKNVGPQSVAAKVVLGNNFSKVAAWGKYQVDVDLSRKR